MLFLNYSSNSRATKFCTALCTQRASGIFLLEQGGPSDVVHASHLAHSTAQDTDLQNVR